MGRERIGDIKSNHEHHACGDNSDQKDEKTAFHSLFLNFIRLLQIYAMMRGIMQAASLPTSSRIQEQLMTHLPLMWFSLAFLAGIVLGSLVTLPLWVWLVFAGVSLALAFSLRFFPLSSLLPQISPVIFNPFPF